MVIKKHFMLFCNLNLLSLRDFNFISSPLPLLLSFVQKLYYVLFIKSAGVFCYETRFLKYTNIAVHLLLPVLLFTCRAVFCLHQTKSTDPELIFEQCLGEFYDDSPYILAMI